MTTYRFSVKILVLDGSYIRFYKSLATSGLYRKSFFSHNVSAYVFKYLKLYSLSKILIARIICDGVLYFSFIALLY